MKSSLIPAVIVVVLLDLIRAFPHGSQNWQKDSLDDVDKPGFLVLKEENGDDGWNSLRNFLQNFPQNFPRNFPQNFPQNLLASFLIAYGRENDENLTPNTNHRLLGDKFDSETIRKLKEQLGMLASPSHQVSRRRKPSISAMLPPWQEFCRLLQMTNCKRFRRSTNLRNKIA